MIVLVLFLISIPVTANDEFEPNDGIDNATSISPGEYNGLSLAVGENDYYEIQVLEGEAINIIAEFSEEDATEVDPELTLFDSDGDIVEPSGSRVDSNGSSTVNHRLTWEATSSQTVFLDIESDLSRQTSTVSVSYDLSVQRGENDQFEPNGLQTQASSIGPGTYEGLTLLAEETDYYEISVPEGETLNVTATFGEDEAMDVVPELMLFDGNGDVIEFSGSSQESNSSDTVHHRLTWQATEDQTVYLDVESTRSKPQDDLSASYDMSVQRGKNDQLEPNGVRNKAPETPSGIYNGLTLLAEENDYYAISVSQGETVNVTATFSKDGDDTVEPELTLSDSNGEVLDVSGTRLTTDGSDTVDYRLTWEAPDDQTVYLRVESVLSASADDFSASYNLSIEGGKNDRFEPNVVPNQAPTIGPGTYERLSLLGEETDYYAVSISAGETLEATATFGEDREEVVAPEITLFNNNGEVLEFSGAGLTTNGSDTIDHRLTWEATDDQTVYLSVRSVPSGPADDLSASYDLSIQRGQNDRFEPNGVPDQTSTIAPGTYDDLTLLGGESDYYAVTVTAGETLEATATFPEDREGAVVPELTLFDSNNDVLEFSVIQLAANGSDTVDYRLTWEATRDQTVFLNVESTRSASTDDLSSSYNLSVQRGENDQLEPNGVRNQAPETPSETYEGLTLLPGENDYYAISASQGETVNVTATFSKDGDEALTPELTLFDADGDVLEFSGSKLELNGSDTVHHRLTWEATGDRTVYLNVRSVLFASADDFSASYNLAVQRGENDQLEPNGVRAQAPETPPGTYDGLTLLGEENDYYAISVSEGETVNVTATFSEAGDDTVEPELTLIDGNGELLESSSSTLDGSDAVEYRLTWEATTDRTVYLRVESVLSASADDFSASYDLSIQRGENDRFEPSGVPGQTPPIGPGTYNGLTLLGGEHDYYTVSIAAGERLEAAATFQEDDEAAVAPGLTLLDADGNALDFSVSRLTMDGNDTVDHRLAWEATDDRTVYLAVASNPAESTDSLTGSYNLTISDTVAPVADAGRSRTVGLNESITLDAGNSTDDGTIASYEWALDNGDNATGERVTAAYEQPGIYTVRLTVIDQAGNEGTDTVTMNVTGSDTQQTPTPTPSASTTTRTPIPDPADTTGPTDTTNGGGGGGVVSMPGFGIGPAVAALLGAGYILRRRLD
jgi:PGF-CTERM protein